MDIIIKYKKTKMLIISFSIFFYTILFLNSQDWVTDINEAKKLATKQNQKIILVFQGSDWCRTCIKLDKEIWSTKEFKTYAKEHFVMLKADFPKKKKNKLDKIQKQKNIDLIEKYHKQGYFPFIVVLNKDGNVLGKTGYRKLSPSEYIKILTSFKK